MGNREWGEEKEENSGRKRFLKERATQPYSKLVWKQWTLNRLESIPVSGKMTDLTGKELTNAIFSQRSEEDALLGIKPQPPAIR